MTMTLPAAAKVEGGDATPVTPEQQQENVQIDFAPLNDTTTTSFSNGNQAITRVGSKSSLVSGEFAEKDGHVVELLNNNSQHSNNNGSRRGKLSRSNSSSRFSSAGLAGAVEETIAAAISSSERQRQPNAPFFLTAHDLSILAENRTRTELADTLEKGVRALASKQVPKGHLNASSKELATSSAAAADDDDEEAPSQSNKLLQDVITLTKRIREAEESKSQAPETSDNADMAANVLTSVLLRSSPEQGLDPSEVEHRRAVFGSNAISEKKLDSFCKLCWEAVQDFVLVMLIVLGIISIVVETTTLEEGESCTTCWIEGAAILCSVGIVVLVTAGIDYAKQFAFIRLTKSLHDTNTKVVIRKNKPVHVTDDDLVVGDILSVNAHSLASIPADCVLLGPAQNLQLDESALTGESEPIAKRPGDVVLSGTNAVQGSGRLVVIAVGVYSVSGKIKARVYESEDHDDDELGGDDENSPLFVKLDLIAKRIGIAGFIAATVSLIGSCIIGFAVHRADARELIKYVVTAITVLAVAVPEGLPLAVTLALAFSSNKMMREQNLVKHLDACETMGCATTICTDKTGTLTANKMTARAACIGVTNYVVEDPSMTLGAYMTSGGLQQELVDLLCNCISINTMDESVLTEDELTGKITGSSGNPTEVALLHLVHDLGSHVDDIRVNTPGRSDQGHLAEYLSIGKPFGFSSARKMMSWAVPDIDPATLGGIKLDASTLSYTLYCKGAQEVVFSRCTHYVTRDGSVAELTDEVVNELKEIGLQYARRGMRCLALAYRKIDPGMDWTATSDTGVVNSDGSPALLAETQLIGLALIGIEDPLRPEVPGAIEKCYQAGIDVRLVTGDNPNTAVSIAYQAGILRDSHFLASSKERVASNLKQHVLMEGKDFRNQVYRHLETAEGKPTKEFDQATFDKIWPHLRVLARSSPDDKLTLAHGLNQSNLFADAAYCKAILETDQIKIFPDRQVVAMTGDGTNDAPALKRADIGFAMGLAGTQIAKDAADIILLDDNFASIVTAAKWGRNVYSSIQKFLQFQLTVNIAAVITALVGSFAYQTSPLAAIQLLWVNLLMDSLASLALASEPPVDELLQKPPVNRTDSMITKHMWANMLGQAAYQVTVVMVLLFAGPRLLDLEPGHLVEARHENSVHYTIIFNAFVWMQLFNEINSRKLKGEFNVFKGMLNNPLFYGILLTTSVLQVLIVQFGSLAFRVAEGGLNGEYWGICMALGFGSLPVQQVINVIYMCAQHYNGTRHKNRIARDAHMNAARVDGAGAGAGHEEQTFKTKSE